MRFFLDTEFIEDGHTIDLVSIGVVTEDGDEFYREVDPAEVPWDRASQWVLENVKPWLSNSPGLSEFRPRDVVKFKREILADLREFVDLNTTSLDKPEFWTYYGAYDWVVVCQLFGAMIDLPLDWPMFSMDLKQLARSLGNPRLPANDSMSHHALADARWNLKVWRYLQERQRDGGQ